MATKYKRSVTPVKEQLRWSAKKFCDILESIDIRCAAADGCVTPTLGEATDSELRKLYMLANKIRNLTTERAERKEHELA